MKRILELVRRTGERCIVTSEDGSEAFVVLTLEAYESLLGKGRQATNVDNRRVEPQDEPQGEPKMQSAVIPPPPPIRREQVMIHRRPDDRDRYASEERSVPVREIRPREDMARNGRVARKISDMPLEEEERFTLEPLD